MGILQEIKQILIRVLPLLLSHHPDCSFFKNDIFRLRRQKICIGCGVSFPLIVIILVSNIVFSWVPHVKSIYWEGDVVLLTGFFLGSFQLLSSFKGFDNVTAKVLIKILFGIGAGLTVCGIWFLPIPQGHRIIILLCGTTLAAFFGSFRLYRVRARCGNCVFHGDWKICYGFRSMNDYLLKVKLNREFPDKYNIDQEDPGREPKLFTDTRILLASKDYELPWHPKNLSKWKTLSFLRR